MKGFAILAAGVAVAALAGGAASAANLIQNGDFSQGATGFTSRYGYVDPTSNPYGMMPEGVYTVTDDPQSVHPYWISIPDGNPRLIVNGATSGTPFVWNGGATLPSTGQYLFSVDVADVCCNRSFGGADDPFSLTFEVSLDGGAYRTLASYTSTPEGGGVYPGAGVFHTLTGAFQGSAGQDMRIELVDTNDFQSGNDFAVDNLAVSAAPEPSTWALMLVGVGGIGLMLRRARRTMGFRFRNAFAA